ncbi:MAG: hypothetical protein BGO67_02805 [Alphaproteobacteria bacterium 41-28]|nr:MAG: hypothetical protein BGO67_02805 [Alphaproteobacteria bacterium 41-28]
MIKINNLKKPLSNVTLFLMLIGLMSASPAFTMESDDDSSVSRRKYKKKKNRSPRYSDSQRSLVKHKDQQDSEEEQGHTDTVALQMQQDSEEEEGLLEFFQLVDITVEDLIKVVPQENIKTFKKKFELDKKQSKYIDDLRDNYREEKEQQKKVENEGKKKSKPQLSKLSFKRHDSIPWHKSRNNQIRAAKILGIPVHHSYKESENYRIFNEFIMESTNAISNSLDCIHVIREQLIAQNKKKRELEEANAKLDEAYAIVKRQNEKWEKKLDKSSKSKRKPKNRRNQSSEDSSNSDSGSD